MGNKKEIARTIKTGMTVLDLLTLLGSAGVDEITAFELVNLWLHESEKR